MLLESLALGVPLVLAKGGPLEAIDPARFVEPGDPEGLARSVVELLTNEAASSEAAARGKVAYATRFHPRVVAAAYDELYDEARGARS